MRRTWTAAERMQIIESYAERGAVALAAELGRSADSVSSQARRHGVTTPNYRSRQGQTRAIKSPTVNTRFFDTTTPATAFVLGYIWACGSVKQKHRKVLRIAAPYETRKDLRTIQDLMGSRHSRQVSEYQGILDVCNSYLIDSLVRRFGVPPGRQADGAPPRLPEGFMGSFAAGHLFAKGSQSDRAVRWTGHRTVIAWIAGGITSQTRVSRPIYRTDRVPHTIIWRDTESLRAITAWLKFPQ